MALVLRDLQAGELPLIPSAPESALAPHVARLLPDVVPPAPWRCRFDSLLWVQRAGPDARSVLPEPLRARMNPRWLIAAFVRYTDSPVGAYSEVYCALVLSMRPPLVAHIPFMAVDSVASLRGGRANWALPKTLATFDDAPCASSAISAEGDGWRIAARSRTVGPLLPRSRVTFRAAQVRPDGTVASFATTMSGRSHLARVEVEVVSGAGMARWLPPGRHLATQWVDASLDVSPATAEQE